MNEAMPDAPGGQAPGAGPAPGPAAESAPGAEPVPPERTGVAAVDGLLERLGEAAGLAADGHLAVYEDVHRGLRAELASLDAPHPETRPHDPRS
ncbi:hypothetical protein [Streptomyces termitum]|uniref:hypothetical protein n=1 Tax=Streptomyces termitum TaxID=67368 RepID=UPI0033BB42CB